MKQKILIAGLMLAAPGALAAAPPAQQPPEQFDAMLRCRAIADDSARLACFDSAAASLQAAVASRDVVVVDRNQIRESRRTLFGLPIPDLPLFGGGDGEEEEEIQSITGVVRSASRDGDGRWLVRLEEGSVWRQIDSRPLALRPRAGMEVEIDRGALGSYRMSVAGQPGIKVRRES